MIEQNILNECRVCLESIDSNHMLSPCNCRGSIGYIHWNCLKQTIEINGEEYCRICRQQWIGIDIQKKTKNFWHFIKRRQNNSILIFLLLIDLITIIPIIYQMITDSLNIMQELFHIIIFSIIYLIYNLFVLIILWNEYKNWQIFNVILIVRKV